MNKEWETVFILAKTITKYTKIIELQFKIVHRIYASDSYVSNFDETVDYMCSLCNAPNNIVHCFAECIRVKQFWSEIQNYIKEIERIPDLKITTSNIIFGIPTLRKQMINY